MRDEVGGEPEDDGVGAADAENDLDVRGEKEEEGEGRVEVYEGCEGRREEGTGGGAQ